MTTFNDEGLRYFSGRKTGTGEVTKIRDLPSLALVYAEATNAFTHMPIDNVHVVTLVFSMADGSAIPAGTTVDWLVDQLNEATETIAFAQVGGINVDVEYGRYYLDDRYEYQISFTGYLSRMAFNTSVAGLRLNAVNQ